MGGFPGTNDQISSNRPVAPSRREIGGGTYGIFEKLSKRAFRTCMGHGGVGPLKKKLFKAERGRVMDFWPFSRNFHRFWGVHMGWCHVHPPNSPHYPHMPPGMGPHGPRTFTHDPPAVGWLSVGVSWVSVGVGWGSVGGQISAPLGEGDPSQVTMFPPQNGAQNLGTEANQGRKWTQHP